MKFKTRNKFLQKCTSLSTAIGIFLLVVLLLFRPKFYYSFTTSNNNDNNVQDSEKFILLSSPFVDQQHQQQGKSTTKKISTSNKHFLPSSSIPQPASPPTIAATFAPPPPMQPRLNHPTPIIHPNQRQKWYPSKTNIIAAISLIVKNAERYLADFVKYHIALGFDKIIIYDNNDDDLESNNNKIESTTHEKVLQEANINPRYYKVMHFPGNNFQQAVQSLAIQDFIARAQQDQNVDPNYYTENAFFKNITHFSLIDVDEYIVLKNHSNIKEFIAEFFTGHCGAITMNWRVFGSCGHKSYTKTPNPVRFVCYDDDVKFEDGIRQDALVKTILETSLITHGTFIHNFVNFRLPSHFWSCNSVPPSATPSRESTSTTPPTPTTKTKDPHYSFNDNEDLDDDDIDAVINDFEEAHHAARSNSINRVPFGATDFEISHDKATIQLNHYRALSYEEFMIHDQMPRADFVNSSRSRPRQESEERFLKYDVNRLRDYRAYNFWKEKVEGFDFSV